jgi:hypothetical protein
MPQGGLSYQKGVRCSVFSHGMTQRGLRPDKGLYLSGRKMKGVALREITA